MKPSINLKFFYNLIIILFAEAYVIIRQPADYIAEQVACSISDNFELCFMPLEKNKELCTLLVKSYHPHATPNKVCPSRNRTT